MALLEPDDPAPFTIVNAEGAAPFLLLGDHAGSAIPRRLGNLGVAQADLDRHIAIDIGVLPLGLEIARLLDAPFIYQNYSRLVVDCNRAPGSLDAIAARSDGTSIPGNIALSKRDRSHRIQEIHDPYHSAIARTLKARRYSGNTVYILSLHSFTPLLNHEIRPWHIGIMYGRGDDLFARLMLSALRATRGSAIGDNQPYAMDDTDYTVPLHAFSPLLPYAEIEVRQDLIAKNNDILQWADLIANAALAASAMHQRQIVDRNI